MTQAQTICNKIKSDVKDLVDILEHSGHENFVIAEEFLEIVESFTNEDELDF